MEVYESKKKMYTYQIPDIVAITTAQPQSIVTHFISSVKNQGRNHGDAPKIPTHVEDSDATTQLMLLLSLLLIYVTLLIVPVAPNETIYLLGTEWKRIRLIIFSKDRIYKIV